MNPLFVAAAAVQELCRERDWGFCFIGGLTDRLCDDLQVGVQVLMDQDVPQPGRGRYLGSQLSRQSTDLCGGDEGLAVLGRRDLAGDGDDVRIDLCGEFDELREHALDRRAGQPVLAETLRGDLFELPKFIEPLANGHQPTLYGLDVQLRMVRHRESAAS